MPKWRQRFMDLAELVATWSKDPSTKVGCVIVHPDQSIAGLGFNGFPRGMSDAPELYADRETKYKRVIHAEMNALITMGFGAAGCIAYVTHEPCWSCAAVLIQADLGAVVYRHSRSGDGGAALLQEAGMIVSKF